MAEFPDSDKQSRKKKPKPALATPSLREGEVDPSAPTKGTEGPSTNLADPQRAATEVKPEAPPARTPGGFHGEMNRIFRCADIGHADCEWQLSAATEDELLPQIEEHERTYHDAGELDEAGRKRLRDAIRERRAA